MIPKPLLFLIFFSCIFLEILFFFSKYKRSLCKCKKKKSIDKFFFLKFFPQYKTSTDICILLNSNFSNLKNTTTRLVKLFNDHFRVSAVVRHYNPRDELLITALLHFKTNIKKKKRLKPYGIIFFRFFSYSRYVVL